LILLILVCCTGIKADDRTFPCNQNQNHSHCTQCTSDGCLLCQFHELKAWNDKDFRDLPPNTQHALYACQIWQNKYEESPLPIPKHSTHDKKDSSLTERDNEPPDNSG
jgi:hypothetical protein